MRFPATEYVASLAMVRSINPASPCCDPGLGALSAHGNATVWRFPRRASSGDVSPTVEESRLRSSHADLAPSDAFPGTEYVALLAMIRFSKPASPARVNCRKVLRALAS